ncbi:MAG: hypothetical protein DME87_09820 [Verrucomicrobia bacterium]|nr:MAG: hypothetical protein DME87_09820 [Verrucomicrobiota bacterium]
MPRDDFSFARVRTSDNDFVATRAVLIYCWRVNPLCFGDNLKWLGADERFRKVPNWWGRSSNARFNHEFF